MPKISIIVPVYKVEKYIRRCLDSIVAQTFTDWECLLVDDGSPDNSGKICDEYAVMDSRFRVFHKENGGVSSARNLGLKEANGEWISLVDSDDWVDDNMLADMVDSIDDQVGIWVYDYYSESINAIDYRKQADTPNSLDLFRAMICRRSMGALWNKLIPKSLYDNINIDSELFFCEDQYALFCILASNKNLTIKNIHKAYYHYFENPSSITHRKDLCFFSNIKLYEDKTIKLLSDNNLCDVLYLFEKSRVLFFDFSNFDIAENECVEYLNRFSVEDDFKFKILKGIKFLSIRFLNHYVIYSIIRHLLKVMKPFFLK